MHWVKPPRRDRRSSANATVFQSGIVSGSWLAGPSRGRPVCARAASAADSDSGNDRYSPNGNGSLLLSCAEAAKRRLAIIASDSEDSGARSGVARAPGPPAFLRSRQCRIRLPLPAPTGRSPLQPRRSRARAQRGSVPIALPAALPNLNALTCRSQGAPNGSITALSAIAGQKPRECRRQECVIGASSPPLGTRGRAASRARQGRQPTTDRQAGGHAQYLPALCGPWTEAGSRRRRRRLAARHVPSPPGQTPARKA